MNLLKKLHQLGTDIREIGLSGDMTQRLAVDAAGEIAGLAENINGMLDALEQSWREVYMNEFRLRHVTENMLDMVSQADARGVFQYLSPSNESILGYKNEEMIGKSVFELMHPDDLDRIMGAFQAAIETGIGQR